MQELVVPPAPHWYRSLVAVCSPDNTLIYGSKNDIIFITSTSDGKAASIRLLQNAHSKHVTSISLNKKWKNPNALIASLGDDNVINIWDFNTFEKKTSNKEHKEHMDNVIGAVFAGDDRVISASSSGFILIWNINTNESKPIRDFFNTKVTLTCLSSCPHVGWLLAFGLNNGVVIVADMRRQGEVLFKLRGHYSSVVGLSWCPAPVNIFPKNVRNIVRNKENIDKANLWVNLVHADDAEIKPEKVENNDSPMDDDFLKECDVLKAKILSMTEKVIETISGEPVSEEPVKIDIAESEIGNEENDDAIIKSEEIDSPERKEHQNRPFPAIYDPSGDFLDDSGLELKELSPEGQPQLVQVEPEEEEPRHEYLLASSGKDQSVYIWRAGSDGRMQTSFIVSKRSKRREKNDNSWMALNWVTPDTILTSTAKGEVLAFPLPKPKDLNEQFRVVHHSHTSTIFNIVSPSQILTASDWRNLSSQNIWTWGQDGNLINYDMGSQTVLNRYPTVTSHVSCFAPPSPLDPNRLAIGLRDGNIRVWDLSLSQSNVIHMQKFQQKFTHKISAIDWHPTRENYIGFGTEEGRVGVVDLTTKKTSMLRNFFHNEVYKVEWGPTIKQSTNFGLYVIAEGKIALYTVETPDNEPQLLELPDKIFVYHFAWKPNQKLLIINGRDGSLFLLDEKLTVINNNYLTDKGLNAVEWHPDAITDDTATSQRCKWFAAGTNKGIIIFDCEDSRIVANLEGHVKPVLALNWCPFEGNRIASVAADGLAHIWDVLTKSIISTFVDSYITNFGAISWSPIDPDLIVMGNKVLRIWSISKNPPMDDPDFLTQRKKLTTIKPNKSEKIKVNVSVKSKNIIVPSFHVSNDENIEEQILQMRDLMDGKFEDALQIFGTKEHVTNLLDTNFEEQKKHGKHKSCEMISLWKGNVAESITNALNENRVTPSIIALAPMVSPKLWQECCHSYAQKLSEESNSDPLEVVSYFLLSHKVEAAIKHLCTSLMFKEALALVKYRLPDSSEILNNVLTEWTNNSIKTGNFETAAYGYLSIKDYENAAKVLSRRNNAKLLKFAQELAEKSNNKQLVDSINFKLEKISSETLPEKMDNLDLNLDDEGDKVIVSED